MSKRRNIKYIYTRIIKTTKDFLLSAKSREFLFFLFFFFIAGAFWLLQTLNGDYETEISIPVRIRNIPDNVIITTEPASALRVAVKDKGTVLLNYMLSKSFFPINFDFNDYKGINNHIRIYASEYEKKVQSQLNVSTRLISLKPDTLEYIYSTGRAKMIPVKLQGKLSAERQYYISDTIYNPDSVLVYAPEAILDTIEIAYTENILLENISDTLKRQAVLASIKGAKFVPNNISLTLPVDIYTEKTVEVPLYGANFPPDRRLRTFPSKVQITFQVGLSYFKDITADNFVIHVPYSDLLQLTTDKYTVQLTTAPKEVSNIRISPPEIDFLIEQISTNEN